MTPERFHFLSEAYGADLNHWPEEYRNEAEQLAARHSPETDQALDDAAMLDKLLASHVVAPADRTLFDSIIAGSPQKQKKIRHQWSWWPNTGTRAYIGTVGLAGVGIAGALAGAFCVSIWTSGMLPGSTDSTNIAVDIADFEQDWTAS